MRGENWQIEGRELANLCPKFAVKTYCIYKPLKFNNLQKRRKTARFVKKNYRFLSMPLSTKIKNKKSFEYAEFECQLEAEESTWLLNASVWFGRLMDMPVPQPFCMGVLHVYPQLYQIHVYFEKKSEKRREIYK